MYIRQGILDQSGNTIYTTLETVTLYIHIFSKMTCRLALLCALQHRTLPRQRARQFYAK